LRGLSPTATLSLLLFACAAPPGGASVGTPDAGGQSPDAGGSPAAALSVSPQARTVLAGAGPVQFTATLSGSPRPITWTLAGPGTLDASSGSTTSYTPPRTIDAATTATVTASAGTALVAAATVTILPASTTIDVAGRVVGIPGNGLAGVTVAIGTLTAVTDADGRFSIPDVTPPYDLALVAPGSPPMAGLYQGLTRPDPTLVLLFFLAPGEPHTGVVSGRVFGGDPIPSDGEFTGVVFSSPEATGLLTLTSRDYTLPLAWFGPETTFGTVYMLRWKSPGPGRPPTEYVSFASTTAVRVTDDQTSDGSLQPFDAGTASISGEVVAPAGVTLISKSLSLEFSDHALFPLGSDQNAETRFNFVVPDHITLTAVVTAIAEFPSGAATFRRQSGIARGANDVAVVLPTPALQSTPADGSTGVSASTEFRWSPLEGGVHLVVFNGPGTKPSFYVVTGESGTRIPDLSTLGAALPPASPYSWFVVGIAPFGSVDDYTGTGFLIPPVGSLDESISDIRRFTTR
jgi:hypothetical protein